MITASRMLGIVSVSAAATLLVLSLGSGTDAQGATSLWFDVGESSGCAEISEGDEIEVQLSIENVTDLQSWEATIVHDRDVLEIISQDLQQFLAEHPDSNLVTGATEPLPDFNGRHLLSAGDLSAGSESGDGVLAVIVFKAVGEGATSITIPQFDINGDGKADEGARLTAYGSDPIGDVNGDGFFDGAVDAGVVAVGEDCAAAETDEPTDPPTPGASQTDGPGGGTGSTSSQPPGSGGTAGGSGSPTASDTDTTPTDSESSGGSASPSRGPNDTPNPGENDDDSDGGSSFPVWLIVLLLAGGLVIGGGVVAYSVRRSSGASL